MTDLDFGTVTLRSGAQNQTSGILTINCIGVGIGVFDRIGICVRLGAGSGGAASGRSPRYMRHGDASSLAYEIRSSGAAAGNPTWTDLFARVPISLLGATSNFPVYGAITQDGLSAGTGGYSSTFSGAGDAAIDIGVSNCAETGTLRAIADFDVRANVANSCEVDAATLDFGSLWVDPTRSATAVGALTVRCTRRTGYFIRLDQGIGAGATGPTDRRMTGPTGQLRYGIYQDPGHSQPWGDSPATSVSGSGNGGDQIYGLYGLVPAGQAPRAGEYSDSVLVTIEY